MITKTVQPQVIEQAMVDAESAVAELTEQLFEIRGETVDSRSDVYSAGCLLYELLTGRPPFIGDSPVAVAYQHVREQAAPPSDHDTDLPPELDAIVMKSLAKRVEDRYQSAAAMRSDIERYLAGRPVQAAAVPPVVPGPATGATQVAGRPIAAPVAGPPVPQAEDERRTPVGFLVLLGLLVIGLVVAGALLWPRLFPAAPDERAVPDVVGRSESQARRLLGEAGFEVAPTEFETSDRPAGRVIDQDPSGDSFVAPGSVVTITVSSGPPEVAVPNVTSQLLGQAKATLEAQGFEVEVVRSDTDDPRNQVLSQAPEAGAEVAEGSTVTLTVSDGPEEVPDVRGQEQEEAERAIRDAGFNPVVREDPTSTEPAGTVVDQAPAGGSTQPQGTDIQLFVSTFVEPTEEPSEDPTDDPTDLPTDDPSPTESPSALLGNGRGPSSSASPAARRRTR